jgi:O-acetyl-ADP-ribose deacetylase
MIIEERIEVIIGDITKVEADAVVNAANESLRGGGGVDGAIHRAAGPDLLKECISVGGCPTGQARITAGYKLPAKYVIHTVGPVWYGGQHNENDTLASCYRECLKIASEKCMKSVAFPAISTGVYRFPPDRAAMIALTETQLFLSKNKYPEKVIFVTFDRASFNFYMKIIEDGKNSENSR